MAEYEFHCPIRRKVESEKGEPGNTCAKTSAKETPTKTLTSYLNDTSQYDELPPDAVDTVAKLLDGGADPSHVIRVQSTWGAGSFKPILTCLLRRKHIKNPKIADIVDMMLSHGVDLSALNSSSD